MDRLPEGHSGFFVLRGFTCFPQVGILGDVSGESSIEYSLAFPSAFSGSWFPLFGQCQGKGSKSHDQQHARGGKACLGLRSGASFAHCWAPRTFHPADLLYLAINFLASLLSYLSLFPHSTCHEISLASYYPASGDWVKRGKGLRRTNRPWLVWFSGLNAGLKTKSLLVQFPVGTHRCFFPSLSLPLHLSLKINK